MKFCVTVLVRTIPIQVLHLTVSILRFYLIAIVFPFFCTYVFAFLMVFLSVFRSLRRFSCVAEVFLLHCLTVLLRTIRVPVLLLTVNISVVIPLRLYFRFLHFSFPIAYGFSLFAFRNLWGFSCVVEVFLLHWSTALLRTIHVPVLLLTVNILRCYSIAIVFTSFYLVFSHCLCFLFLFLRTLPHVYCVIGVYKLYLLTVLFRTFTLPWC